MQHNTTESATRRLVLIGGGHAHVTVLRAFGMRREPGLEITLIAKELDAPYSGMLPGYVAGHYDLDACHIDLVRLAHFAGARLIHGEAVGIDTTLSRVHILGRPAIAYNLLSIDTGITPAIDGIAGGTEHAIAVKPVSTFAPKWIALEERALQPQGPRRIAVAGTGAAGFEIVLAVRHRLRERAVQCGIDPDAFSFALIGSGRLLASHNQIARRLAARELMRAGVDLIEGDAVVEVDESGVRLESGRRIATDATLLTTKAAAPGWFADTGLALDGQGFLAVEDTLQVVGQDDIFAAGDCAAVLAHPREKAGVFAVRQGPALTRNIRLRAQGLAAKPFWPQRHFLTLLSCGDKNAIASRGPFAAGGRWAWRLKDRIDRDFMAGFQELPGAMSGPEGEGDMLCAGCAAKLGPAPLSRALRRFSERQPAASESAVRNLAPNDDAALLDLGGKRLRLESIDHFPAIWPEPYVLGEIAAAHALSDILAKGGKPDHALALASLPMAAPHLMEDDLFQLLAGASAVLERDGVSIVGGHTARADQLGVGFFVSGEVARDDAMLKSGLIGGEVIVLTKALGTGIIFAGWMRRLARAREVAAAVAGMRVASTVAVRELQKVGATAVTDVTGFGLAGHLIEMLEASGLSATIGLEPCLRYPGVDRLIKEGVRSSLLGDNLALADRLLLEVGDTEAALALLFDPQTSGGLVAGVPRHAAREFVAALSREGVPAAMIGEVHARGEAGGARPPARLRVCATFSLEAEASPGKKGKITAHGLIKSS
ncbi:MAG: selenide, water dikinase SelD [Hyphomicrobiaceae bacterium]